MDSHREVLIREISKQVVAEICPTEIQDFDVLYSATRASQKAESEEVIMGSGLNLQLPEDLLTPPVVKLVIEVLDYLFQSMRNNGGIANIFRKKRKSATPLSKEQLALLRKIAEERALDFGIKKKMAKQIADSIVGSIVLKTS